MTTKLAQSRLRMGNQEKHRDKQLRDLMACNYEVYLAEAETKVNWFKMKLLTKDIHDVKEVGPHVAHSTPALWLVCIPPQNFFLYAVYPKLFFLCTRCVSQFFSCPGVFPNFFCVYFMLRGHEGCTYTRIHALVHG